MTQSRKRQGLTAKIRPNSEQDWLDEEAEQATVICPECGHNILCYPLLDGTWTLQPERCPVCNHPKPFAFKEERVMTRPPELRRTIERAHKANHIESRVGVVGAFGDGSGKWRLQVTSDVALQVQSLLDTPTGFLTNLSQTAE